MNRKLLASLILLTALIIFTAGCKPKGISKSKNYKLANEIVKNDIKFKYFTSKAKVTIPLNKINVSAPVEIRIKKDSTIWLLVKMPMIGLEMMRGMITQDSVFILNKQQKSFSKYSIEE